MRRLAFTCLSIPLLLVVGCSKGVEVGVIETGGAGGNPGAGGSASTGGTTGSMNGSGGSTGNGGIPGTGGNPGTGGSSGKGGSGGGKLDAAPGTGGGPGVDAGKDIGKKEGPTGTGGGPAMDGGGEGVGGEGGSGSVYNPDFKEFYGEDCQVGDPKDANLSTLPDLFTASDGARMSKKSEWRCQRAYLKKVIEKYIHGEKPGTPEKVTGSVSNSAINVKVEHGGKSISFSLKVSMPSSASGPVPIIIGMGSSNLDAAIVKAEGVATTTFDHQGMSSESNRSGLFSNIYGNTGASAQIGWAWGVSRIIDVLVAERDAGRNNIIDPTAVGVTGCSRNGKGAFTVGAFDERIALGIPQESGTCGVSALRIVNTQPIGPNNKPAESLSAAKSAGPAWFGTVFDKYINKVDSIPGDMHAMVAMYAPRGLLVLDNSRIGELCSTCEHASSVGGGKVYEALGVGKNIEYHGGNDKDPHDHCTFYTSQAEPLKRAIRAHLTKKAAPDGRIAPAAVTKTDLAKWIPWSAPTLADDISWDSPPLTKD
jgi:hypothetical protein